MSDKDISRMDFKQLRNEVQLLRDELAMFKRKYEDAIYNIGTENLDKSLVAEQDNVKARVMVTADAITSTVQSQANLKDAILIKDLSEATDRSKTYKIQSTNEDGKVIGEEYYYYNSLSKSWEKISGDTVYTMFTQTDEGFILKGNTVIDGTATITRNLVLSGNVTWDMENSPVLTQYSSDGYGWHSIMVSGDKYMQMSFDGGRTWSSATKVVGEDANVTAQSVFNVLTDGGENQGLFSAFYEDENKLFINAEFINTEYLSATRLYAKGYSTKYYAKMASAFGDFGVYGEDASDSANPISKDCIWGVYHSDSVTGVVNFYSYGTNYMGYNKTQDKIFPKGTWDFSACDDVLGLDAFVSGGSGGGTVVAVFG